jgi:hypothetical protein
VGKSYFSSLLVASFVGALFVSSARAQNSWDGFTRPGSNLGQPETTVYQHAAPPDDQSSPFNVSVVKSSARIETSASLLFLQPSSGNLVYATLINPLPFLTPNWSDHAVNPSFTPAFNVGVRYIGDCGGDVQLSWTHLNTHDTSSATANPTLTLAPLGLGFIPIQALGPSFLIGPPPPFASANAMAHFGYDAINLDAGIWLAAGNRVQMRFFAGLQSARINQTLSTFFQSPPEGAISFTDSSQSVFTGIGPRLGMDVHYTTGNFDFVGGIAGTMLIGSMRSHINFITNAPIDVMTGVNPNPQYLTSPSATRVIPGLDTRLGASYSIPLGNFGCLKFEAGYQAAVYFGAINQYSLSEVENNTTLPFEGTSAVFLRTAVESQSNFLVHGPYAKFTLQF